MKKAKAKEIIERLSRRYIDKPALEYKTPYELLIAVILSAQCTDKRVNEITRELFKEYNTPERMQGIGIEELERKIYSCGLYRTKAQHIKQATEMIIEKYNGQVPSRKEDLLRLAGVGRKTANVVYAVAFNGQAIAVDTHVFRVSNRIGLTRATTVEKTEKGLMELIPPTDWSRTHHYLIYLGRDVCSAKKPRCNECIINALCEKNIK